MYRLSLTPVMLLMASALTGCNDYGSRLDFDGSDLFYTENVTEEEANRLGEYLKEAGYFTKERRKSVQLDKADNTYQLRLVVEKDKYKSKAAYPGTFLLIGARVSRSVFDGKPVEVHLCDDRLKTLEVLSTNDVGCVIRVGKNELQYHGGTTEDTAEKAAELLKEIGYFSDKSSSTVRLTRKGDGYQLGLVVIDQYKTSPAYPDGYRGLAIRFSKEVADGKPVEIQLLEPTMKVRETLSPSKQ